jgi:hypothetical protein
MLNSNPPPNPDLSSASQTSHYAREEEVDEAIQKALKQSDLELDEVKEELQVPKHVKAVKTLSDYRRNSDLNMSIPDSQPSQAMVDCLAHDDHQGGEQIADSQLAVML